MSSSDMAPEERGIGKGADLRALFPRLLRVLAVTALAVAAAFAFLTLIPRIYQSTAGLVVEQRAGDATPVPFEALIAGQIGQIRSRDALLGVIDSENLRSEPEFSGEDSSPLSSLRRFIGLETPRGNGDEAVLARLDERLGVAREGNSPVILVTMRTRQPELSARLANAVAAAHVNRSDALDAPVSTQARQQSEQEIALQRTKVQQAEAAVADYRAASARPASAGDAAIPSQEMSAIASQISSAQERKDAALSRSGLIRTMIASGQPFETLPEVRDSIVIEQLGQTRANLQSELAQRSSTLLDNHPTMRSIRAQLAGVEEQLAVEGRRVADGLDAQARVEGDLEQQLREKLATAQRDAATASEDSGVLEGLEADAQAQRDVLQGLLLRSNDLSSPVTTAPASPEVRQVTFAVPSTTPVSPNAPLILSAVGLAALALQIGGIIAGALMPGRGRAAPVQVRETSSRDPIAADSNVPQPTAPGPSPVAAAMPAPDVVAKVSAPDAPESPEETVPLEAAPVETAPSAPTETVAAQPGARELDAFERDADVLRPAPVREEWPAPTAGAYALELANLSADIAIGRVRIVLLAALAGNEDCERVADTLTRDALRRGLSVARVDGGSGRATQQFGLSDLAADRASFGDVVHRVREGLAEVPWGRLASIEHRSMRPTTLIEALTEIYEAVIITTGRIGMTSSLPTFTGTHGRLVLVTAAHPDRATLEAAVEDAANLGMEVGQLVQPQRVTPEVS